MSNKKNLLIYAHYYIPDTASTGQILRELAEGMLDKFNITVICVVPSYLGTIEDKYKTQKYYEEEINGVKVLRIRVPEFSKTNKKSRVKNIVWGNGGNLQGWKDGLCVRHLSAADPRRPAGRLGQVDEARQVHLQHSGF